MNLIYGIALGWIAGLLFEAYLRYRRRKAIEREKRLKSRHFYNIVIK